MTKDSKVMGVISRWVARYYLKKPDQAEIIRIKYPRLSDLWPALLNELCYRFRSRYSYRLTSLNVELTNRCNLACRHCPRTGSAGRVEQDMDFETFKSVVDGAPHLATLLPYQWGEPLLSPVLYDCIAYAAQRGIRVMVTTNGLLLDEGASRRLLQSGLSRLTLSFDGSPETHAALRQVDPNRVIANAKQFRRLRDEGQADCALDLSMVVDETTEPCMEDFSTLFAGIADRVQYIPRFIHGARTTPCRELWRGVLVVLSNGDVTVCCADPEGKGVVGNIAQATPSQLFNSPAMQRMRRSHGCRDFPPLCCHCAEYDSSSVSPRFS